MLFTSPFLSWPNPADWALCPGALAMPWTVREGTGFSVVTYKKKKIKST